MDEATLARLKDRVLVAAVTNDEVRIWLLHEGTTAPVVVVARGAASQRHHRAVLESRANDTRVEDAPYFDEVAGVLSLGSHVVLVGHGHGKSNAAIRFREHVSVHRSHLAGKMDIVRLVDLSALTDAQVLADARSAWGRR